MKDILITALISSIVPTLGIIASWISTRKQVTELHVLWNSRLTELIKAEKKVSHEEGKEEGIPGKLGRETKEREAKE